MPSAELIRNFQESNKVRLDSEDIRIAIDRILTVNVDNKERESKIREYVQTMYPKIAAEYERNKVRESVLNTGNAATTTSWEFFEGYMNIVSEITKEASDSLIERSKEDAQKAKEAVDAAKADYDKKVADRDRIINNYKLQHNGSDVGLEENQHYKTKYKEPVEMAEIALKNAKERKNNLAEAVPYEFSMDYFGIREADANAMLENQVNSYTYMEARRAQIKSAGATSPAFMRELENALNDTVSYHTANDEDKKRMQEVYATKQLMQERLDSKKGLIGWLWKLVFRAETKAMRNYINTATARLAASGFEEANERTVQEATDAMSKKGYFFGEYQVSGSANTIAEKFANNESVYASEKQKEEALKAEQAEREKQLMEEKAAYRNEIKNQLFEIKFRPANTVEQLNEQMKAYNEARAFVKDNKNIPEAVNLVFKANGKKIQALSNNLNRNGTKAFDEMDRICAKYESELAGKISVDNYKPMSFDEIQTVANAREPIVNIDLGDKAEDKKLSEPIVEEPTKEKEPLIKNN